MGLWKEIKRSLNFWIPISKPPRWVWEAYKKWERPRPHPYYVVKYFVGKNHIYKVVHGMEGQGQALY